MPRDGKRGKRVARRDAAVMWALGELRRVGRALQDGTWHPDAAPTTVPQALAVMTAALAGMVDLGLGSVAEVFRERFPPADLVELVFDDD